MSRKKQCSVDMEYFGGIDLGEPEDENLLEDIAKYLDDKEKTQPKALVAIQLN